MQKELTAVKNDFAAATKREKQLQTKLTKTELKLETETKKLNTQLEQAQTQLKAANSKSAEKLTRDLENDLKKVDHLQSEKVCGAQPAGKTG